MPPTALIPPVSTRPRHAVAARARAALLLALALALGLCTLLGGCGGPGRLEADQRVLDFGRIVKGQAAERSVRITNGSRRAVLLTAAIPSCKCLVVDPSFQRSLQPGESTSIRVRLESWVVPAQKFTGKHLDVRSDDPEVQALIVALHGEIVERLSVTPAQLRVGPDDAAGRGEPRRVRVRTPPGCRAEVEEAVVSHPEALAFVPEPAEGGLDLVLQVKGGATLRGPLEATLRLKVRVSGCDLPPETSTHEVRIQGTF
ncbi:MAG: DUF1573 domain-containing protein [Planctomycetia bacterium]